MPRHCSLAEASFKSEAAIYDAPLCICRRDRKDLESVEDDLHRFHTVEMRTLRPLCPTGPKRKAERCKPTERDSFQGWPSEGMESPKVWHNPIDGSSALLSPPKTP